MSAQAPLVDGLDLAGWRERALQAEAQLVRARALVEGLQAQTEQRLQEQQARITALERQMAELAARQNQDSSNSHNPPSRDNDKSRSKRKGRNRKSRRSSGRKAGGQPGHKGHHRAFHPIDEVDHIVDLMPENCERCHASLDGRQAEDNPTRYQQSELPPVQPILTEHRVHSISCSCGHTTRAAIRKDQMWCTGPRLMATIAALAGRYRLSRDETTAILRDLMGVRISEGTVQAVCERVSDAMAAPVSALDAFLRTEPQLFLDETGWRQKATRYWLWVMSSPKAARFCLNRRRSSAQVKAWLAEGFLGRVTSDRWSAYTHLDPERRQLCWAHLDRDFKGLVDADPNDHSTALIVAGIKQMWRVWRSFQMGELSRDELKSRMAGFRTVLRGWAKSAAASKVKGKKRGLAKDLIRFWPAVFAFVDHEGIEPTNNQAERDLRPAVLWRKGSFGTRSEEGRLFVERILSAAATCRRQSRSLLDWLTQAVKAAAGLVPVPTLVPAAS